MKKYTLIAIFLSMNIFSDMVYKFDNLEDELRFNNLIKEIRCPKCTSGSLSSSNAPISEDLKLKIVEMIKDGKSDSDIKEYVSDRFGKESLYDPEFSQQTFILWLGPLIFIVIAYIFFISMDLFKSSF